MLEKLYTRKILEASKRLGMYSNLTPYHLFQLLGFEIGWLQGESGCVDSSLEYLLTQHPDMQVLRIKKSQCTDEGLQYIFSLGKKLTHIELSESEISGDGLRNPHEAEIRLHLKELSLKCDNGLTDSGLKKIISYIQYEMLETLDISSEASGITETGFISLLSIIGANLRKLNMRGLEISLSEINSLTTTLSNLEDLDVSRCGNFTETGFITLLNIVGGRLRKLRMSYLKIELTKIHFLTTTLSNLEDLDISRCERFTESGFISLLNIVGGRLRKLNMSSLKVSLSEINSLTTNLQNLEDLDISWCDEISEALFISLLSIVGGRLRRLKMVMLRISLSEISSLTSSLPNLEDLNISDCSKIPETVFISLINIVGGHLRKLNISGLRISLSEMNSLTTTLPNLEDLDISDCSKLTETTFISLLNIVGGHLRKLNMSCNKLCLSEVSSLTTSLGNLEDLDISYCKMIPQPSLTTLLNAAGGLKRLEMQGLDASLLVTDSLTANLSTLTIIS